MKHISKTARFVRFVVSFVASGVAAVVWLKTVAEAVLWSFFTATVVPFDVQFPMVIGLAIYGKWTFEFCERLLNWGFCFDIDQAQLEHDIEQGRLEAQAKTEAFFAALRENDERLKRQYEETLAAQLRRQAAAADSADLIESIELDSDAFNQHDPLNQPAKRED